MCVCVGARARVCVCACVCWCVGGLVWVWVWLGRVWVRSRACDVFPHLVVRVLTSARVWCVWVCGCAREHLHQQANKERPTPRDGTDREAMPEDEELTRGNLRHKLQPPHSQIAAATLTKLAAAATLNHVFTCCL
mmetsp:Transcript_11328/g.28568  ORF Transcript_11328/g.28568 Transcript_11328/m.28568 type:complete len:135 (-) Transcript_11328:375-779(-)